MTLLYSFGHWGSYSFWTKKLGSLNDCIAICADETVLIEGGTWKIILLLKGNSTAKVILTRSGLWNDLWRDISSMGFLDFRSITGANFGAAKVLLGLFKVGVNVGVDDFGGPILAVGVKGFLCDCIIFNPLDQPTASSVGGAPRSSSSYKLIVWQSNHRISSIIFNFHQNGLCLQFQFFSIFAEFKWRFDLLTRPRTLCPMSMKRIFMVLSSSTASTFQRIHRFNPLSIQFHSDIVIELKYRSSTKCEIARNFFMQKFLPLFEIRWIVWFSIIFYVWTVKAETAIQNWLRCIGCWKIIQFDRKLNKICYHLLKILSHLNTHITSSYCGKGSETWLL